MKFTLTWVIQPVEIGALERATFTPSWVSGTYIHHVYVSKYNDWAGSHPANQCETLTTVHCVELWQMPFQLNMITFSHLWYWKPPCHCPSNVSWQFTKGVCAPPWCWLCTVVRSTSVICYNTRHTKPRNLFSYLDFWQSPREWCKNKYKLFNMHVFSNRWLVICFEQIPCFCLIFNQPIYINILYMLLSEEADCRFFYLKLLDKKGTIYNFR